MSLYIGTPVAKSVMASQVVSSTSQLEVFEMSIICEGLPSAYVDIWTPVVWEVLLVKRETNNSYDINAVAVYREDVIVGHIPFNLAPRLSAFLWRDVNKVFAEVAGAN